MSLGWVVGYNLRASEEKQRWGCVIKYVENKSSLLVLIQMQEYLWLDISFR